MDNFEYFGPNLRRLILGKNYKTYQKAADDFEISLSYLNQLMRNEREPSMDVLKRISDKLGVPAAVMLADPKVTRTTQEVSHIKVVVQEDPFELIQDLMSKLKQDPAEAGPRKELIRLVLNLDVKLIPRAIALVGGLGKPSFNKNKDGGSSPAGSK